MEINQHDTTMATHINVIVHCNAMIFTHSNIVVPNNISNNIITHCDVTLMLLCVNIMALQCIMTLL